MIRPETSKNMRINLRLDPTSKQLIEQAASFEGKTVSSFILASALATAKVAVYDNEVLRLNTQDAKTFLAAISKPVRFNAKLMAAFKEHQQRVDLNVFLSVL